MFVVGARTDEIAVGRVGFGRGLTGDLVGAAWIGANVTRTGGGLAGTEGFFVAGASVTRGAMVGEAVNGTAVGLFVVIRDIVGETVAGNGIGETVVGAGTGVISGAVVTLDAEAGDPVESSGHELGGFEDTWHIPCAIHSSYALTLAYTAGVFGLAQPEKEEEM